MGSRDRRLASGFAYNYFRLGKALADLRMIERLTIANFLCSAHADPLLAYCLEKFSTLKAEDMDLSLDKKIEQIKNVYSYFNPESIFPFSNHLSDLIDKGKFIQSFYRQPKLWIRIRKDFAENVFEELKTKNISFEEDVNNPLSVSLLNATSLEKTDSFMKGYFEIQDWSSQQTLNFIQPQPKESWWDTCAGSGGKSLMLFDAEPSLKIFATDKRSSMLKNLEERFEKIGLKDFKAMEIDLAFHPMEKPVLNLLSQFSHLQNAVLADVPCSGSGTWARTPEWLSMFHENSIDQFVLLQRTIVSTLAKILRSGSPLIYITCSVFKEENEMNVDWIVKNSNLALQNSGYIEGTNHGADTMFVARFIKS